MRDILEKVNPLATRLAREKSTLSLLSRIGQLKVSSRLYLELLEWLEIVCTPKSFLRGHPGLWHRYPRLRVKILLSKLAHLEH